MTRKGEHIASSPRAVDQCGTRYLFLRKLHVHCTTKSRSLCGIGLPHNVPTGLPISSPELLLLKPLSLEPGKVTGVTEAVRTATSRVQRVTRVTADAEVITDALCR